MNPLSGKTVMHDATRWRMALAKRIAAPYARHPNARVVMVAGSVSRGCADRYSDIEIDVYYDRPPTETERIAAVEGCGATVTLLDEDADEWEEQMNIGGFYAHSSTFLVQTMERYLTEVVEACQISPLAQVRLSSLQHAVTIKGATQVQQWREKANLYPLGLTIAMLKANLPFEGFWYAEKMLAARDDLLPLYDIFVKVERQILWALLGLNRIYLPTPDNIKWMDEVIDGMELKPKHLSARLKQAFHIEPKLGVRELKVIIAETLDLVETHLPEFDTTPYRNNLSKSRPVWDKPPTE